MLDVETAISRTLALFPPSPTEQVALADALDRVLSAPLPARIDHPAFDNSAMDGYAMRFSDLSAGVRPFPVTIEVPAGSRVPGSLAAGQAARIFTGAPMPMGADTVVMQEEADATGSSVCFPRPPACAGQHVRQRASDVKAGETLLPAGAVVGAGEIALLAAQGLSTVPVHRRPTVAIVSTGDELVESHDAAMPLAVVNSNAHALSAMVRQANAVPWVLPIAGDTLSDIKQALTAAATADVVLCTGGVSVGDYDYTHQAFEQLGITTDFWKVAIKPGKPLRMGHWNDTPIVGLPGNPISAMITFEIFVRPALLRMAGHDRLFRPLITAEIQHDYSRRPGRTEIARATLKATPLGSQITLLGSQGSGALRSMVGVDALALFAPNTESVVAGDAVRALVLRAASLCPADQSPFVDLVDSATT